MSSFAYQERINLVEDAFADTYEILVTEEIGTVLGRHAMRLAEVAQDYFVPNLDNGVWEVPRSYAKTDKVPVIPTARGETAYMGKSFGYFTPTMRMQLRQELSSLELREDVPPLDEIVDGLESAIECPSESTIAGATEAVTFMAESSVRTNNLLAPGTVGLRLRQNPIVQIAIDIPLVPSNVTHELVHKIQFDNQSIIKGIRPGMPADEKELRAYQVGAVIEAASGSVGTQSRIESLRQRYAAPDDPYRATPALVRSLKRHGMHTVAESLYSH